jgi:hypothetical protein
MALLSEFNCFRKVYYLPSV